MNEDINQFTNTEIKQQEEISTCACMGPMFGEPHCYCKMISMGLELNTQAREERKNTLKEALVKIFPNQTLVKRHRVDVLEVLELKRKLAEIDKLNLEDIDFYIGDKQLQVNEDSIKEWKFVGLSNTSFIEIHLLSRSVKIYNPHV